MAQPVCPCCPDACRPSQTNRASNSDVIMSIVFAIEGAQGCVHPPTPRLSAPRAASEPSRTPSPVARPNKMPSAPALAPGGSARFGARIRADRTEPALANLAVLREGVDLCTRKGHGLPCAPGLGASPGVAAHGGHQRGRAPSAGIWGTLLRPRLVAPPNPVNAVRSAVDPSMATAPHNLVEVAPKPNGVGSVDLGSGRALSQA